jgi:hypothetical protein
LWCRCSGHGGLRSSATSANDRLRTSCLFVRTSPSRGLTDSRRKIASRRQASRQAASGTSVTASYPGCPPHRFRVFRPNAPLCCSSNFPRSEAGGTVGLVEARSLLLPCRRLRAASSGRCCVSWSKRRAGISGSMPEIPRSNRWGGDYPQRQVIHSGKVQVLLSSTSSQRLPNKSVI